MTVEELSVAYPVVFHMAAAGSWHSIAKHGLLSTSALLDLFEVSGPEREKLEAQNRRSSTVLRHPDLGIAVVRDQRPMSNKGLIRALSDGLTPEDWYRLLNRKVFFWPSRERLDGLASANTYRSERHLVLTVDTRSLASGYGSQMSVTNLNTGCTVPFPHPRGLDSFVSLESFDYNASRRRRGRKGAIAELVVEWAVPDIAKHVVRAEHIGKGQPAELVYTSERSAVREFRPGGEAEEG